MATSDEEHVLGLHDEIARLTQERDAAHARGIAEGRAAAVEAMNDCAYCASGIYACSCERAHARGIAEGRAAERAELLGPAIQCPQCGKRYEQAVVVQRHHGLCDESMTGPPHLLPRVDEPKSQLLGIATPGREGSVSGATSAEDEAVVAGVASVTNRQRMQLDKVKSAAERITRDHRALIKDLGRNGKGGVK